MIEKEVTAGFRPVNRDTLGFTRVVAGVQNGCGQDCAVCLEIVTGALGYLGVESKTFRLNRKLQPYARAGFNKFPCRDAMGVFCFVLLLFCVLFFISLQVVLSVRSGWAAPASQRSFGICICCVWLGESLCEEILCRIWASWGHRGGLLLRMLGASGACGARAGQLPRVISASLTVPWL